MKYKSRTEIKREKSMPTVKMGSGEECFNFKLLEDPAGRTRKRSPPQVESESLQNINLVDIFQETCKASHHIHGFL